MPKLFIHKLFTDVHAPEKATQFSAGYDIRAYIKDSLNEPSYTVVYPGTTELIKTGLQMRPDENYCIKLFPRSGLALKHGITLGNCVGLGDADYSKPYGVIIHNHRSEPYTIYHEERICQIKIERVEPVELVEVQELPALSQKSIRTGGFGHTGK